MNVYEVQFSHLVERGWRGNGHRWVLASDAVEAINVVTAELDKPELRVHQVILRGHDVLGLPSVAVAPPE